MKEYYIQDSVLGEKKVSKMIYKRHLLLKEIYGDFISEEDKILLNEAKNENHKKEHRNNGFGRNLYGRN